MQKKYKVRWNYKSSLGGPWTKGSVIELDEVLAARVNLDSPDVLMPVPERAESKNRLGSAESTREKVNSEALVDEEKDPLPASPLKGGGEDGENEPEPGPSTSPAKKGGSAQGPAEDAITEEDFKAVKLPEDRKR